MIGVFYRGGRSCDLGNLDLSFDSAKAAGKRNYLDKVNRSINIVKVIKYLSSIYIFLLLVEGRFSHIAIQGSRSSVDSGWITDDGSPLPYFPTSVNNAQNALNTALVLHAYPGFRLDAVNPEVNRMTCFACEIES